MGRMVVSGPDRPPVVFAPEGTALEARVSVPGCAGLFAAAVARVYGGPAVGQEEP